MYLSLLFRTIPTCALHHSYLSFHYHGHDRDGVFNIALSVHKISISVMICGLVSCWTWIWLRDGIFCQHVDTLITLSGWDIHGTKLSPAHPHISGSIWEHLAQNHAMFSKLLSICASGDAWGNSLKIIVNYEYDYLKYMYTKTCCLLVPKSLA